jgi:hypothetical protein
VGSKFTTKAAALQEGKAEIVPSFSVCGPLPSCYQPPRLIHQVLHRGAQAVVRGGARCAFKVLDRGARPVPAAPRMYLVVVYRPFPAAPLVVRCMYLVVVP